MNASLPAYSAGLLNSNAIKAILPYLFSGQVQSPLGLEWNKIEADIPEYLGTEFTCKLVHKTDDEHADADNSNTLKNIGNSTADKFIHCAKNGHTAQNDYTDLYAPQGVNLERRGWLLFTK